MKDAIITKAVSGNVTLFAQMGRKLGLICRLAARLMAPSGWRPPDPLAPPPPDRRILLGHIWKDSRL